MIVPGRMRVVIRRCISVSLVLSGTWKTSTFCDPFSTTLTPTYIPMLSLSYTFSRHQTWSISTVLPKPPSLISAFRILLEQVDLSSLSTRVTVGFERLVSSKILLPEICIAHRNIRCSQVLNTMLDLWKDPELIQSHIRHFLFAQCHMYPSFTCVVSATSISEPPLEQCWQLAKNFRFTKKF